MTRFAEALAADGLKAMKRMSGKVNMETLSLTGADSVDLVVDRKFKNRPEVQLCKNCLVRKRMSQFSTLGETFGNIKTSSSSSSAGTKENNFGKRFNGVGHTKSAKYTWHDVIYGRTDRPADDHQITTTAIKLASC